MTQIEFRVMNETQGRRAVEALNGKTYMNLEAVCYSYPCKGNERVNVTTMREDTSEAELFEMVLGLLADALR